MLRILLQNNEELLTRKENLQNIPFFKDKLDNNIITLNVSKKYMNTYLDDILNGYYYDFEEMTYFTINVRGKIFNLTLNDVEKFEYLKSQFLTFKNENVFLDMNDEKFELLLNDSKNNFKNVKNECSNELLYLSPVEYIFENIKETQIEKYCDRKIISDNVDNIELMDCYFTIRPDITFFKKVYRRFTNSASYTNEIKPIINNCHIFTFQSNSISNMLLKIKILLPDEYKHKNISWITPEKIIKKIDLYYGENFLISISGMTILMYDIFKNIYFNDNTNECFISLHNVLNSEMNIFNFYSNKLTLKIFLKNPFEYVFIDEHFNNEYATFETSIIYTGYYLSEFEYNKFKQYFCESLTTDNIMYEIETNNNNFVDFTLDRENIINGFLICIEKDNELLNPFENIEKIELITDNELYFSITPKLINIFNIKNNVPNTDSFKNKLIYYNFNVPYSDYQPNYVLNLRLFQTSILRIYIKKIDNLKVYANMIVKNIYIYDNISENVLIEKNKMNLPFQGYYE
jgi:hypothetical protein